MYTQRINTFKDRLPLLSWIILPLLAIWFAGSYIIGINKQIQWDAAAGNNGKIIYAYEDNKEIKPLKWNNTGLVTLWFDDAWYSQYAVGLPILENYKLAGAVSVPTSLINGEKYMTWPQVKRLQYKGWEITSHTMNHICDPKKMNKDIAEKEAAGSLDVLRRQELAVHHYVTACGFESPEMKNVVKNYYLSSRTTGEGYNPLPVKDPYNLQIQVVKRATTVEDINAWVQEANAKKAWVIIVFHQIGNEGQAYEVKPYLFKSMINAIAASGVPVVLPSQALAVDAINEEATE